MSGDAIRDHTGSPARQAITTAGLSGTAPEVERAPAGAVPSKGLMDSIIFAFGLFFLALLMVAPANISRETYVQTFLLLAAFLLIIFFIGYLTAIRRARREGGSSPGVKTGFLLPLLGGGILPFIAFVIATLWYEVWRPVSSGAVSSGSVLPVSAALFLASGLYIGIFCSLRWPAGCSVWHAANAVQALAGAAGFTFRSFRGAIIAAVLLNTGIATIVILAARNSLDIDLMHAGGFFLFLLFASGNFLILAMILVKPGRAR